ncbi:MAG TPA: gamma-glutamyl-gamma-aminobutyrate hydrolase family protein [Balneolaceae bacterium]|nr:gamma-glutamyl-gamma-aminobutyrate hydrolase family protein [Balneolaceae bacterium]
MSRKKPNIGITGPDKGGTAAWWFTKMAVFLQGGKAIRIQPKSGMPSVNIHGLIIGGGADINPERYGGSLVDELFENDQQVSGIRQFFIRLATVVFFPVIYLVRKLFSTKVHKINDNRDELELELLDRALNKGIPVLGICRGAQLLNIYFGGTLYNDIGAFYSEIPKINSVWPKKKVEILRPSKLYEVLNYDQGWVNALHHQAVDTLGDDLKIVAREETGIIQAIEHTGNEFVMGVQWHPEYLPQIPSQRRLFKALVKQATFLLTATRMKIGS